MYLIIRTVSITGLFRFLFQTGFTMVLFTSLSQTRPNVARRRTDDVVHVTRLSPEVAVSRTGQHSSVILPIIYFHPLKRPRLRLQSGLPAALPFSLESRERLHSGDNVHRSTFERVHSRARVSVWCTVANREAAFKAVRIADNPHVGEEKPRAERGVPADKRRRPCSNLEIIFRFLFRLFRGADAAKRRCQKKRRQ